MLMTEEEARKKWCPHARVNSLVTGVDYNETAVGGAACNRAHPDSMHDTPNCIGSGCMAFRWVRDATRVLKDGRVVIVDHRDTDLLTGEPRWWDGRYCKGCGGYLHRQIAERVYGPLPKGMYVDHIDGDALNNRRANLRLVSPQQNGANSAPRGGKSKFRCVYQSRNGRWASQIAKAGVRLSLGTFDTEEEAAAAYDKAAADIHGQFARLNLVAKQNSGRLGYCGAFGKPEV